MKKFIVEYVINYGQGGQETLGIETVIADSYFDAVSKFDNFDAFSFRFPDVQSKTGLVYFEDDELNMYIVERIV